jgi:hypothetical protein
LGDSQETKRLAVQIRYFPFAVMEVKNSMSSKGLDLPKEVTKFLVYSDNAKYLRYMFGGFHIYIEEVTPLYPVKENRGQFQRPTLLTARFDDEEQIRLLLAFKPFHEQLQIRRIFKSGWTRQKNKDKIDGFMRNCAKNVLHMCDEKTLRVTAKDDPDLQKKFYDTLVKMNEAEKKVKPPTIPDPKRPFKAFKGCKFDYDKYDVTFWIKTYTVPAPLATSDKIWIITSVEGFSEARLPTHPDGFEHPY